MREVSLTNKLVERNTYDKSIIEELITPSFIKNIIESTHSYTEGSDWTVYTSENFLFERASLTRQNTAKNCNIRGFDKSHIIDHVLPLVIKMCDNKNIIPSGWFYYPPTGYMGWHTNSNIPSTRLYVTYSSEENKSFFRYFNNETKEIITDYDDKGITIRKFKIPSDPPDFWHCVGSNCDRVSFGFRIYE